LLGGGVNAEESEARKWKKKIGMEAMTSYFSVKRLIVGKTLTLCSFKVNMAQQTGSICRGRFTVVSACTWGSFDFGTQGKIGPQTGHKDCLVRGKYLKTSCDGTKANDCRN